MNTPRRTIRIEDELWTAAAEQANEEGTTVTEVIRKALSAYVKASAVVLVVMAALFATTACGGAEAPATPASEPTVAATVEVESTDVPVVEDECWTETGWLVHLRNISADPAAAVAFLDTLPDPSEGCTAADQASLQNAADTAVDMRERFPTWFPTD